MRLLITLVIVSLCITASLCGRRQLYTGISQNAAGRIQQQQNNPDVHTFANMQQFNLNPGQTQYVAKWNRRYNKLNTANNEISSHLSTTSRYNEPLKSLAMQVVHQNQQQKYNQKADKYANLAQQNAGQGDSQRYVSFFF
jgi:hypothetical protein